MKSLGEAFGLVLALLLRGVGRAVEWMGVAEMFTLRQAGALACGLVLMLWVCTGKVTE